MISRQNIHIIILNKIMIDIHHKEIIEIEKKSSKEYSILYLGVILNCRIIVSKDNIN